MLVVDMRARMPYEQDAILREVLRNRINHMISGDRKMRSETLAFWNQLAR